MIISDMNYLEVVSKETNVWGGFTQGNNANNNLYETVKINKDVYSNIYLNGNVATAESEANAYGYGSLAEIFTNTETTPYSSSASGTSISASNSYPFFIN